jgi:hypothetical protein
VSPALRAENFFEELQDKFTDYNSISVMRKEGEEGLEKLILFIKMGIKMIDIFKYPHIVDISYLNILIHLEKENKDSLNIWNAFNGSLEMIRKALKSDIRLQDIHKDIIQKC